MDCTLCFGLSEPILGGNRPYFWCQACDLRFLDPALRLSLKAEAERYLKHQNDLEDPGYAAFLSPLVEVLRSKLKYLPETIKTSETPTKREENQPLKKGLDYGSGKTSYFKHHLEKSSTQGSVSVALYDPFFHPSTQVLENTKYDFIICSETAEHFYHPRAEFEKLRALLINGGFLAVMTELYQPETDFLKWNYLRDQTHVTFYSAKTLKWIQEYFKFSRLEVLNDRIAIFQ